MNISLRNAAARKFKMEKRAAQPSSAQLTREKHVQNIKWTNTTFWRENLKIKWTRTDGEINTSKKYGRHKYCTAHQNFKLYKNTIECRQRYNIWKCSRQTLILQHWPFFVTQIHFSRPPYTSEYSRYGNVNNVMIGQNNTGYFLVTQTHKNPVTRIHFQK